MKLGSDTLVITDVGVQNISELYRDYKRKDEGDANVFLPNLLTYDVVDKRHVFKPIVEVNEFEETDLYVSKFQDMFMSKTTTLVCSKETEIFRYDILPQVSLEPIIGGSYNVYAYLKANWDLANPGWEEIGNILNYGAVAPNLASGDLVVRFNSRKFFANDTAYEIKSGKEEVKIVKKTGEQKIMKCCEDLPIYVSQSFHFNYNFILVR